MIKFTLNNQQKSYSGDGELSLLKYLRTVENIVSPKDGCSGQGVCGACTVQIEDKAMLSCRTSMSKIEGKNILTIEGIDEKVKDLIAKAYVSKGAVQCGFCTPGLIVRTKVLLENNLNPSKEDIIRTLNPHLCRCTGYKKIIEAVQYAALSLQESSLIELPLETGKVGSRKRKYEAYETALGQRPFVDDLRFKEMEYGVLRFSDHPRAKVIAIDVSEAQKVEGVSKVFTSKDIPGERYQGLIEQDWPVMIEIGEETRYVGDVLAGVVAKTEDIARFAASKIKIDYEILKPVTDMHEALKKDAPNVHKKGNLLEVCKVDRGGNIDEVIKKSDFVVTGIYETQRIEHGFLETESTVARPLKDGIIEVYSCGQGVYVDRKIILPT